MNWDRVNAKHPSTLLNAVRERVAKGSSREIELGPLVALGYTTSAVSSLLDELHDLDIIERRELLSCPSCGGHIAEDVLANQECPQCGHNFREEGDEPTVVIRYFVLGGLSRDVPWLVAIHGFNTRGEWQREFGWLVASKFRYHAPVLMYQYPMSRYGVLFRWRHLQLARELGEKLRRAVKHAADNGIADPPDVVLHSFGSLIFATLLEIEAFNDLRFGRILIAGGIVDPRYDFTRYIDAGRCDAVLNHCGSKDRTVGLAQIMMPTAGPCGTHGLQDSGVLNVRSGGYGHGTFFEVDTLSANLTGGGTWDRFLRMPKAYLDEMPGRFVPQSGWRPLSGWLIVPLRLVFMIVPLPVVAMAINGWVQDAASLLRSIVPAK